MRVMCILKADEDSESGRPPTEEEMGRMGALIGEMVAAGVWVDGGGLKASKRGKRIKVENGQRTVIDGPFAETKELVSGYAILEVADWDELWPWMDKFSEAIGGNYESELRPMNTEDDWD